MPPVASCSVSCSPTPVIPVNIQEIFEDHKLECLLGAIALSAIVLNRGELQKHLTANGQLRDVVSASQIELNKQLAESTTQQSFEELANLRYDGYCEPVFNLNKDGIYTALTLGQPVIKGDEADRFKGKDNVVALLQPGHVLPEGTPVCDAYGNTSSLSMGPDGLPIVKAIASTTDPQRIHMFIQKHGGSKELSVF